MNEVSVLRLKVIRFALLAGVLLFGVVAWFVTGGTPNETYDSRYSSLRLAFAGMTVVGLSGVLVLRKLAERTAEPEKRIGATIAGWALAEGTALLGGVILLLTGRSLLYFVGIGLLLTAFALLPVTADP